MKNNVVLVTGCCGMIGSNLCHWLIDKTDLFVVGVDDLSGGYMSNSPNDKRFLFFKYNVCNEGQMKFVFDVYRPNVVFHLACYAAEGRSNYIRTFIHKNNTVGAANIINFCVSCGSKLIFTSSVAVYSGKPPYNERMRESPIDEYGLSKLTTEKSIQIAGEQQGLDWCIVRPRNVYGEYQSLNDEARNVMGIWMRQIKENQPMTIFGDGSNKRCFTYIGDLLKPLHESMTVSKEIINLGSPIAYPIIEANKILQEVAGYDKVVFTEARHEVEEATCETLNSEVLLKYKHKTELKEGLTKMWNWAKDKPLNPKQIPPPLEIKINTHSSIK